MSTERQLRNRLKAFRQQLGWSQDDLAKRAGISRAAVSAIEIARLAPSVESALSLSVALGCRVEDLFSLADSKDAEPAWAWPPPTEPCRYWVARVGGRTLRIPVEPTACGTVTHDGIFQAGAFRERGESLPEHTLVMASCDPAGGLLASEFARVTGDRLLLLHRSSRQGLDLLQRGLVDVAGMHLASAKNETGNAEAIAASLGGGYSLLKVARWQEGLTLGTGVPAASVASVLKAKLRWVGREPGSGARQCQDELLHDQAAPRRLAADHRGVAEAVRRGWAEVGVCVRLASEEAGLKFLPVREEAYDVCFATSLENDPRVRALVEIVRSASFRAVLGDLPGYDSARAGDLVRVL